MPLYVYVCHFCNSWPFEPRFCESELLDEKITNIHQKYLRRLSGNLAYGPEWLKCRIHDNDIVGFIEVIVRCVESNREITWVRTPSLADTRCDDHHQFEIE